MFVGRKIKPLTSKTVRGLMKKVDKIERKFQVADNVAQKTGWDKG